MSENRHLKKRLVRATVADNLATRENRPPVADQATTPHRPSRARWRWFLLALPLAALPLLMLVPTDRAPEATPLGEPTTPTATSASTDSTAPRAEQPIASFPAPIVPVDTRALPLAVRRVVVDPGHGGDDHGTVTGDDQLLEKELALDIGLRLRDQLEKADFDVVMTRTTDRFVSLRERAALANGSRADLFVSIHLNWIVAREVRGVETYYLGPTDDPRLVALARRENQQSGYSLADLRGLLDGIYADLRQDESRQLAQRVQRSLLRTMLRHAPDLDDRGVKTAPFVVLTATEMPAILAEVSCLSNREEAARLARPGYREHIAEALFRGIQSYADAVNSIEEQGS